GPINNTFLSSESGADPEPSAERVAPVAALRSASRKGGAGRAWQPQGLAKGPWRLLGAGTVALFGLLVAGGVVPWLGFPRGSGSVLTNASSSSSVPPPPSFTLHNLEPLILHPDESKRLTLTIDRKEFAGVVRIAASEAAGLRFVSDDIVATTDHGTLNITVEPTAALRL